MTPGWYLRRLSRMDVSEVAWRTRNMLLQAAWRRRQAAGWPDPPATHEAWNGGSVPAVGVDVGAARSLLLRAKEIEAGRWQVFGKAADVSGEDPDWFRDPGTGRQAPAAGSYAFDLPYRDQEKVGNVKNLWEVSRLHHLTVLAAAFHETGEARYAERALAHLASWCRANPPLQGIHWVSGIELGLRLIAFVWMRRLLAAYPGVTASFEHDETFRKQLHAHQAWIAAFYSRGSSANNHLIAEMAGLLAAARAFPLFPESAGWAAQAAARLERESKRQTFRDGLNRELASDYHVFVLELLLVAGIEADATSDPSRAPLSDAYWRRVRAMADALAATVDAQLGTARQGDGDDGRVLVLDGPEHSPVGILLQTCAHIFGPSPWWPETPSPNNKPGSVGAALLSALARPRRDLAPLRAPSRPSAFTDGGIALLRDAEPGPDEIWCRVDCGPHGFLATAAHAHADALSFELRLGGLPILVDAGTYCYHGEGAWRDYFRSTLAHNTLTLAGRDQAVPAGPFLWLTRAEANLVAAKGLDTGDLAEVEGCHDGYRRRLGAIHRRRFTLDRRLRTLEIVDWIDSTSGAAAQLAFHLHPQVACQLVGRDAHLSWSAPWGPCKAVLALPPELAWATHRGETDPIRGWYSPGFGCKEPTILLLGTGQLAPGRHLRSRLTFVAQVAGEQRAA